MGKCLNNGASLSATGLSSATPIEPVPVSPVPASIPSAAPRYIVRSSGGNDSIALIQYLRECGLKRVTVSYSNTGWATPEWEARMVKVAEWVRSLGWQHVELSSIGFEDMVRDQTEAGMFPTRVRKFCTKYLKIKPFLKWVGEVDPEKRALICVGVRRAESDARKGAPAFLPEQDNGRHVWHPLVEFSDADRDAMIAKTPFEVLPHRSDECAICINGNRADLRRASEDAIARVEALEEYVGRPMFDPRGRMGATGIRQVIDWAKAERGQYQAPGDNPPELLVNLADHENATCEDAWCGS